jgi:hypothetical protein
MPRDATYEAVVPSKWQIKSERSSVEEKIILTSTEIPLVAESVSLIFRFSANKPDIEVEWQIRNKKPNPIPEGGWLCFPFKVESPKFIVGRLGAPIDLSKDQIVGGNRHLYGVNTGTVIASPDGSGVGLCAMDAPCMSFGEPGLWKYTYDYLPKQPTAFVNLYNNMWNTNFPYWTEGSWNNRVRIWPVNKTEKTTENLAVKSYESRYPLLAVESAKNNGTLPAEKSGLSVSRKGVLVTAFGRDPDGNKGTLLRIWEQAGISGELTITLPKGSRFTTAQPVNLRGMIQGVATTVKNESITVNLNAYVPASFILN